MDNYLFKNAHDALVFAFNYSGQQFGRSLLNTTMAPVGSGKGLSGVDGAGQAGMIRAAVARMGRIPEAILTARFAPRTVIDELCSCPACDKKHPNREWTAAIEVLAQYLKENLLEGNYTSWDMRTQYIMRLFIDRNKNVTFDELASRNNVHKNTVVAHFKIVRSFFLGNTGWEHQTMSMIEDELIDIGMVGRTKK